MSLFACGIIHQGLNPERFSKECRGRREAGFICVWALYLPIREKMEVRSYPLNPSSWR